ncbi:MAG: leucine-rich repeat domain-containing protein [Leptolyngbya sp. SIO1E4]|nr:leucine-rich repeat domain-containing protein [Leptolyngbya sp. SIO1E4]
MPSFLASSQGLQQLHAAKARLNLSFAAIAKQAGVSVDTVSRLFHPERGKRVSQVSIEAVLQVLDLRLEEIVPAGEWPIEIADNSTLVKASLEEAEKWIRRAIENKSNVLDLSGLKLVILPKSIGQLKKITRLYLQENQLTSVPKELGNLSNLQELYLHNNYLSSVPKELGQLNNLTELHLHYNQLSSVPKELSQLNNLTGLYLHHNQLNSIPKELGSLTNLSEFYIARNRLSSIPKELGQLINLKRLDVSVNQLPSIPKEIGQLTKLTHLDVSVNQLSSIPKEIGQLTSLKRLDISVNQLSSIPKEIGRLTNLNQFFAPKNRLTSVPKELGQLTKLTRFNVSANQLRSLPKELSKLVTLTQLDASVNKITSVPIDFLKLTELKILAFRRNKITELPNIFGQLKKLEIFDIRGNHLTKVPDSIAFLTNLRILFIHFNKLTSLPISIGNLVDLEVLDLRNNCLESLPETIGNLVNLKRLDLRNNHLRKLPENISQLIVLDNLYLHGNENLGISMEILGPGHEEVRNGATPTNPQDILNYYFRIQSDRTPLNEAKLILVGFGTVGKTSLVNRLIHDTFDPNSEKTKGIQITPWEMRLNNAEDIKLHVWDFGGQEIMHSTHQFFLTERSLYLLVLNGRQGHEDADAEYWLELIQSFGDNSPVIVVLNKVQAHPFDVNRRALQEKFPAIRAFIHTDCGADIGISELRTAIERETDRLEYLRAPFPSSWVTIKDRLTGMPDNYISFEKYRDICQQDGETDLSAQDSLAVHLHSLGIALNYKDDTRLRDTHVLNPHWVTNGIYTLLNAHELADTQGELAVSCLTRTLDPQTYPRERHGFLLELMRKFELCFPFAEEDNRYLIPDLLDKQQPREATEFNPANCLNFRYRYPILPEGLLPRFIVRTHVLSEQQLRWRTGVILNFEGNRALVKADRQDRCVTISVDGPITSRRRLLAVIRSDFDRIHRSFKFIPQELVPIPGHPSVTVTYKDLLVREKKGRKSFEVVLDNDELLELNVQDLLNGVDIEGSRQRSAREEGRDRPLRLFYSYSHRDEVLRDQLDTHLKILERQNLIQPWHDRRIDPGMDYATEIDDNLNQADIILLLVSADFISSKYCYEIELPQALQRHKSGEATVIPILLRPVDWQASVLAKLNALPTNWQAVTQWGDRDAAWLDVETGIKQAVASRKASIRP